MNTGPEQQQADGAWDKLKGNVKEGVGGALGDRKMQAEGMVDQATGEAKMKTGQAREGVEDALEHGDESQKASGVWDKVSGKVKEEWGDLTDNASLEARGQAQQAAGHAKHAAGEARDDMADRV